jgi:pimeloyl-ACP methyl ester carboxylesterase
MNALHDERLFTHYFADVDQLQATVEAWRRPDGGFDLDSFLSVLGGYGERGAAFLATGTVTAQTLALFGALDPVTPFDDQVPALRAAIPGCRIETLANCSHYVHLDRPRAFVDTVLEWAASSR